MSSSSDPLPYTQVDRAVKAKAAVLASALGFTNQHALGSLQEFWELNGDVRELERIIESGGDKVIVNEAQALLRFRIASGKEVSPDLLIELGFIERVEGGVRVRGMSRYLAPIRRRLQARKAAAEGGKVTASKLKRAPDGSFMPAGPSPGDSLERPPAREPAREPSDSQANDQATAKQEPKREPALAVSGQRPSLNTYYLGAAPKQKEPIAFNIVPPDLEKRDSWLAEDFWRWAQWKRQEAQLAPERWPHPAALSKWWAEARGHRPVRDLQEAFYVFASKEKWQKADPPLPWNAFASEWHKYLPRAAS